MALWRKYKPDKGADRNIGLFFVITIRSVKATGFDHSISAIVNIKNIKDYANRKNWGNY